jgi:hypothetical protein
LLSNEAGLPDDLPSMVRWPEGEGHDKGFIIAGTIVCDLTDDVARSRMRNGSTASFPDLFSTSVEPNSYDIES